MKDLDNPWRPFEPSGKRPWDLKQAAHLYRRAGFGASWAELLMAQSKSPGQVVDDLPRVDSTAFTQEMRGLENQIRAGADVQRLPQVWLYRMLKTEAQHLEKTTLFWHGHFATSADKVDQPSVMLAQHRLLRSFALGNFKSLVQQISQDPAMLTYLDSKENRKTRPNENYARELLELFCLGLGNYTEDDIKEISRAFTGWEIRDNRFRFNQHQHDFGTKSFLGQTGTFDGKQAVEIILEKSASSMFIAGRLVNYFVCDEPCAPKLLQPIADLLEQNGFEMDPVIRVILKSQFFHDSVGQKIRSPVELGVGLFRNLEATGNTIELSQMMKRLGQLPFFPPNVKGWPGGRQWINSSTILTRANLIGGALQDEKTKFAHGDLLGLMRHYDLSSNQDRLAALETLFMAQRMPEAAQGSLLDILRSAVGSENERLMRVLSIMSTFPEFQLG